MRDDPIDLKSASYTPVRLLNETAFFLGVVNDNQLAIRLDVEPAQLCRIRHRKEPISPRLMVQIMDRTNWTIRYVRELAGMPFVGVLTGPCGPHNGQQKLSDEEFLQVRAMPGTQRDIARQFHVSPQLVSAIKKGMTRRKLLKAAAQE